MWGSGVVTARVRRGLESNRAAPGPRRGRGVLIAAYSACIVAAYFVADAAIHARGNQLLWRLSALFWSIITVCGAAVATAACVVPTEDAFMEVRGALLVTCWIVAGSAVYHGIMAWHSEHAEHRLD